MESGFEVLGAAVGSKEFVASCIKRRFQNILSMLDNLHHLNYHQCALGILRNCLGTPKLVYSLRTNTQLKEMLEVLKTFDDAKEKCWIKLLAQFLVATHGNNLPYLLVFGSRRQTVTRTNKGAFVGSIIASD